MRLFRGIYLGSLILVNTTNGITDKIFYNELISMLTSMMVWKISKSHTSFYRMIDIIDIVLSANEKG